MSKMTSSLKTEKLIFIFLLKSKYKGVAVVGKIFNYSEHDYDVEKCLKPKDNDLASIPQTYWSRKWKFWNLVTLVI